MKQKLIKQKINKVPPLKWEAPTNALIQYFDATKTDKDVKLYSDSLNEILRFGTNILGWFREEYQDVKFCNAVSGLFVEQLQRIDALAGMFRSGAYSTSPIILRSMVEIFLQLKYLMDSNSDVKALSLQFMGKIRRIEFLNELLESSPNGKRVRELLNKDNSGGKYNLGGEDIPKEISKLENEISAQEYKDIFQEYKGMKKKRFEWYSLFSGPNELRNLAEKVGETGLYYMCYRRFNDYVHGTQWFRGEQYWKKPGTWVYSLDVRPLESAPLFDETFLISFRTLHFLLSYVHIDPDLWPSWSLSCKLLRFPGFQNFAINTPDGKSLDIELA